MSYAWKYWDETGEHDWSAGSALPNGADLFKVDFLNQFTSEINKRFVAINQPAGMVYLLSGGEDVLKRGSGWASLIQSSVNSLLAGFFCKDQTAADAVADNVLALSKSELATLYPSHWTSSGMRITKVHPSDPSFSSWEYGSFGSSVGYIFGPWLFEDWRLAIDRATLAKPYVTDSNGPFTRKYKSVGGGDPWPGSWTFVSESDDYPRAYSVRQDSTGTRISSVSTTHRDLHADTWTYFGSIPWSIVYYAKNAYGENFDAQGTPLVQNAWAITNSGTLTSADGLLFEKYAMDPMPDPPMNSSVGGSGFDAVSIGLGFYSAFLLLDIS